MEATLNQSILVDALRAVLSPKVDLEVNHVFYPSRSPSTGAPPLLVDLALLNMETRKIIGGIFFQRTDEPSSDFQSRVETDSNAIASTGAFTRIFTSYFVLPESEIISIAKTADTYVETKPASEDSDKKDEQKPFSIGKTVVSIALISLLVFYTTSRVKQFFRPDPQLEEQSDQQEDDQDRTGILLPDHRPYALSTDTPPEFKASPDVASKKIPCQASPPVNGTMKVYESNLPKPENSFWTFTNTSNLHAYVWLTKDEKLVAEFYISPRQSYTFKTPPVPIKYDATLTETWCSPQILSDPTQYQMRRRTFSTIHAIAPNTHANTTIKLNGFYVESSSSVDKIEVVSE